MTGEEIKERRIKLGLTQTALARALGVTASTIARWERDEMGISPLLDPAMKYLELTIKKPRQGKETDGRRGPR